ncbi:hypothetical protein [Falsibacillus albus]|nr:hypothetical protein [Falsibacillus albus]
MSKRINKKIMGYSMILKKFKVIDHEQYQNICQNKTTKMPTEF